MRAGAATGLIGWLIAAGLCLAAPAPITAAELETYLAAARLDVLRSANPALGASVLRLGGGSRRQGGVLVCGTVRAGASILAFLTVWRQGEAPEQGSSLVAFKAGRPAPDVQDLRAFDRTVRLTCRDAGLEWLLPPPP